METAAASSDTAYSKHQEESIKKKTIFNKDPVDPLARFKFGSNKNTRLTSLSGIL
jgi:hypothetical protein